MEVIKKTYGDTSFYVSPVNGNLVVEASGEIVSDIPRELGEELLKTLRQDQAVFEEKNRKGWWKI